MKSPIKLAAHVPPEVELTQEDFVRLLDEADEYRKAVDHHAKRVELLRPLSPKEYVTAPVISVESIQKALESITTTMMELSSIKRTVKRCKYCK